LPGRILDGSNPHRFVAPAQIPDGCPRKLESIGQRLYDGRRIRHRQQDSRTSSDSLLRMSVADKALEIGCVFSG
jgi:hypothetical protein